MVKINKKLLRVLIGLTTLCVVLGVFFMVSRPTTPIWNGLQPGEVVEPSKLEQLGALPATISGQQTGLYEFLSDIPSAPNTITIDPETNALNLISIEEPLNNPPKFNTFAEEFGRAELELYRIGGERDEKVFAYPSRGLAFFVHIPSDTVYRRWYFSPISSEEFLVFSHNQLTATPPGGERFEPRF